MIKDTLKAIVSLLKTLYQTLLQRQPIPVINQPINPPIMETNSEKFLKICLNALDTDVSPANQAPQELSCAEGLSSLIKKVFPDFPVVLSTIELFDKLKADKRLKATLNIGRAKIIISPRVGSTPGHCGAWISETRIASNNSKNGLWQGTYDFDSWIATFGSKGRGLHTYIFELV